MLLKIIIVSIIRKNIYVCTNWQVQLIQYYNISMLIIYWFLAIYLRKCITVVYDKVITLNYLQLYYMI